MPGSMASHKKLRNSARLPLALNPLKSKDVLAVLAERNQAVVPVGAWVEPASPQSSEIPAYTSACIIEKQVKEQLRKKQEALKHFQRQVKYRVNQQIRLRKKQQLQKSYEAAEKEGCIAMRSSDPAYLTPKRTSVFPNHLNAAIGSARLPPSQMLGDGLEDRENQNQLFQQAQALSQTMKQARHQLASFKTMSKKNVSVVPDETRNSFPTQEEPDSEESSSVTTDKKGRENLFWSDQQDLLLEDKDKPLSRVRKIQFKNPLFAVMKEEEPKKVHLQGPQDILPETQDYLPEAHGDLTGVQSTELEAQNMELRSQALEPEGQAVEPKAQVKTETQGIMLEAHSVDLEDESIQLEVQQFLSPNQAFLPEDQSVPLTCQDQNFLPNDKNIPLVCQDQHFLCKVQTIQPKCQDPDFIPKCPNKDFVPKDQHVLLRFQEQHFLPRDQCVLSGEKNILPRCQDQDFLPRYQNTFFKLPPSSIREETVQDDLPLECRRYVSPQASSGDQSFYLGQQPTGGTVERRGDLLQDGLQHLPPKHVQEASSRRQVYDKYQSKLNTEFQVPLALQLGMDGEEDRKERQKQYLRYRRLFMDIEREQVKEQQRQKEHRRKIEKIKKKKEQQRYAEEQRILRMNLPEEPCSEERMSEMLAQLELAEVEDARQKQHQREKEYQRYVEALRAQIQEKLQLYNITLPPLCCCGPGFWDAHPDTCANNCIFYKNHRAYTRALHSVLSSCDIPEGNSTLRVAIHNFASAHRRTFKNV
ncbi:coiled-coil domain-containing protein 15 [Artibeus jamaicensis]|uniref:coiled-coil domain-containing protein 15 n=1 Tax=Artibeus jamaicensis TaxID=9417 RepID=UPI00235A50AF|nr:coiled-coil domain-containing protein 15 [Artibeus jamaicensis]XP_053515390.1 coiled-coil domain-containing protein 15 [Artibeus jamaicensis]